MATSRFLQIMSVASVVICGLACPEWESSYRSAYIYSEAVRVTKCDYSSESPSHTPTGIRNDTEYLSLESNGLTNDQVNLSLIDEQVTTLVAISLYNNQLTQVPDFSLFSSTLRLISLAHNSLQYINLNDFVHFHVLRTLNLDYNDIAAMESITPVHQLSVATVTGPTLESTTASTTDTVGSVPESSGADSAKRTVAIELLDLNHNPLADFDFNAFIHMPRLDKLEVQGCCFDDVIMPKEPGTIALKRFIMGECSELSHPYTFDNLTYLEKLSLLNEQIVILDLNDFTAISSTLIDLSLSRNIIRKVIPLREDTSFEALDYISLSQNAFDGTFNMSHFNSSEFPKLDTMRLSRNHIDSLSADANVVLSSLTLLVLTHNKLHMLDLHFFLTVMPKIKEIDCARNSISLVLSPKGDNHLVQLEHLILDNNPLKSLEPYCPLRHYSLHLRNTLLRCDDSLLWLYTCTNARLSGTAYCMSPLRLQGKTIDEAGMDMALMAYGGSSWLSRGELGNSSPSTSVQVERGLQDCARLTGVMMYQSFTYNSAERECQMYHNTDGQFKHGES